MTRKEVTQTLSELRHLIVCKIKRDVRGGIDAGGENQGITAVFVNVDQNYDAVPWEVFQEV